MKEYYYNENELNKIYVCVYIYIQKIYCVCIYKRMYV